MQEFYADHGAGFLGPAGAEGGAYADLAKALQAGSGGGLSSVDGRALVLEDLEPVLRNTTFGERQFVNTLFRKMKANAEQAKAIMHEFAQLTGYGETGAFNPEITSSLQAIDVDLQRSYAQVRFLRNKRSVSKVSRMVGTMASMEDVQVLGGTRYLTSILERYLYSGDSAMTPDEWDGLMKIANANGGVIDMAGAKLDKPALDNGALTLFRNQGVPSDMYHGPEIQSALDTNLVGQQDRINLWNGAGQPPQPGAGGYVGDNLAVYAGMGLAGYRSSFGDIKFNPHIFTGLRKTVYKNRAGAEVATHASAPATPTTLAGVAAAQAGAFTGSGTGGALTAGKYSGAYAGTYHYRVSAENSLGESIPAAAVSVTVTAAQKATITWDAMAGATCYRVYRSRNGGGAADVQLIARVTANTYVDINQNIAGCFEAYLLDMDSPGELKTVNWAQLAPMSRDMLPAGDTTIQWIQFIFGVLICYAPTKIVAWKNVGLY